MALTKYEKRQLVLGLILWTIGIIMLAYSFFILKIGFGSFIGGFSPLIILLGTVIIGKIFAIKARRYFGIKYGK